MSEKYITTIGLEIHPSSKTGAVYYGASAALV